MKARSKELGSLNRQLTRIMTGVNPSILRRCRIFSKTFISGDPAKCPSFYSQRQRSTILPLRSLQCEYCCTTVVEGGKGSLDDAQAGRDSIKN